MIQNYGSTPILNHIPCNESNSQNSVNPIIDNIRKKYNINGCDFDIPTSINFDGKEVDKNKMWKEGNIYHHPNVQGSLVMFEWLKLQTPKFFIGTGYNSYGKLGTTINRPLNKDIGSYYYDTNEKSPI